MNEFDFFWPRENLIDRYDEQLDCESINQLCLEKRSKIVRPYWQFFHQLFSKLPSFEQISQRGQPIEIHCNSATVSVGKDGLLDSAERQIVQQLVDCFKPWRKGPFSLFGIEIDAEWRSNLKWERIAPHLPDLAGKKVCDVGCGNGYYMWRLAGHNSAQAASNSTGPAQCIIGLDPSETFLHVFELFQKYIRDPRLQLELLGIEQLPLFPKFFDLVLCLGVIYHQRNPFAVLEGVRRAIVPGGQIIIESLAIEGEQPLCLVPRDRYAKARNVYFIPTPSALVNWLSRAGFVEVEVLRLDLTTVQEQRPTAYAPFQSLVDYLNPNDPRKTVEGYPAPRRVIVRARV